LAVALGARIGRIAAMRASRLLVVGLALVAVVAAWWAGSPRGAGPGPGPVVRAKVPGLVIVCLDTLRADATEGPAGGAALPSLGAFARDATRFPGALAACSWTGPSVATLLTGLQPWNHGIFEVTSSTRLPASVPTLATVLREAGWTTAAVTGGGWLSEGCGLPPGFDQYDADFDQLAPAAAVARWQARRPLHRPFLLFLHSYAPHDPYGDKRAGADGRCDPAATAAGAVTAKRFAVARDDADPASIAAYLETYYGLPCERHGFERALGGARLGAIQQAARGAIDGAWRALPDGEGVVARLRARYHGPGLAYVEARLRATLEALASLPRETVIVVCSDHGEAFGEHGPLYHGRFLHPELVRALLVVRAPGWPAGDVAGTVGLVDVVPTLLEVCGVPAGGRVFDGASFADLVRGAPRDDRPVVSAVVPPVDAFGGSETYARRAAVRDARFAWSGRYDVRQRAWVEEAWFDRGADPQEFRPLAAPPAAGAAFDAAVTDVRRVFASRFGAARKDR